MPSGPDPIVPVPAIQVSGLRARRAIIGVPGIGFRGELRADDSVIREGRTFVPILSEHDYYRSELEQVEFFAPLVPIDRVWIETVQGSPQGDTPALDVPHTRRPVQIDHAGAVTGRRIVQQVADGFVRDLRALSEPYPGFNGFTVIRVCTESDWYSWPINGRVPGWFEIPTDVVWLE